MASLARFYFSNFCYAGIFWKLPHFLNSSQKNNSPFFNNLDLILTLGWRSTRKNVFLSLINFEVETWTEVALNFCVWKRGAIFAPKIRLLPRAFFVSKTRISYKLHIISLLTGRYELNKLASLPMCGFIAQLVEHRTGIAEVTGSNPVEALIFSCFFFPIA